MGSASARLTLAGKAVRARGARAVNLQQRRQAAATRALGHALTLPSTDNALPESRVRDRYRVGELILDQGAVPVIWWSQTPNLGDLLSPWLIGRMTGRPVVYAGRGRANYVAIGSVINLATPHSTVWGAGSFGTERRSSFSRHASYRAVRGPLTRSRLLNLGLDCPAVYGDPALLVPHYFAPEVAQTHEVGIVIRHTESRWRHSELGEGVRLIDFGSGDVEQVLLDILSCRRIVSSSLHGLVLADAYGIPNAWLNSASALGGRRPNGGDFKYYDYFISVNKLRPPQDLALLDGRLEAARLVEELDFADESIEFDPEKLLDACPFLTPG